MTAYRGVIYSRTKTTEIMEDEFDYLSEKIEQLSQDRDYQEREQATTESVDDRTHYGEQIMKLNTEIEILENILSFMTQQYLLD